VKVTRFDSLLTYALVAINLAISYSVLQDLALVAGLGGWQSYAWPLTIDALILVSTRAAVEFGKHQARRYAWFLLWVSVVASVTFNVVHILLVPQQVAVPISIAVGAIPPIGALLVTHLAIVRARVRAERRVVEPDDETTVAPDKLGWLKSAAKTVRDVRAELSAAPDAAPVSADAAPAAPTPAPPAAEPAAELTQVRQPQVNDSAAPAAPTPARPLLVPHVVREHIEPAAPDAAPAAPIEIVRAAPAAPVAVDDTDARREVLELLARGLSQRAIERETQARGAKVSTRTIGRYLAAALESGELVETGDGYELGDELAS
jgi:hypothetical protein